MARTCLACASTTSATCGSRILAIANALPVASSTTRSVGARLCANSSSCCGVVAIRPAERARPPSAIATWQKSRCTSNPIDLPTTTSRLDDTTRGVRRAERHLRIRARGAPGRVAGAASYTSGLAAHKNSRPARPRSPRAPVPERPEPTIRLGRSQRLRRPFSCRYTTSRDLTLTAARDDVAGGRDALSSPPALKPSTAPATPTGQRSQRPRVNGAAPVAGGHSDAGQARGAARWGRALDEGDPATASAAEIVNRPHTYRTPGRFPGWSTPGGRAGAVRCAVSVVHPDGGLAHADDRGADDA